jgi:PBSX family phage terminase large subunit
MTDTVVRIETRGAALELFKCRDNECLLSGAAGTGKSVGALLKIHLACLAVPGIRTLVVRKTHASLTASTLVTFREKVAAEGLESGLLRFYGGSAQEPASFQYDNGSVIVVGGLDKASRLLSTEYDMCFIDEAIEVTEEDIDIIVTRLRNGKLPYQQLIMATNPGPPTHHLKRRADVGRCRIMYSIHEDNPRMYANGAWTEYGQDYLKRLDSLTGARYQRMRWGKWVASEGAIYEAWNESIHVIEPFWPPKDWTRWWAVDFGFVHPFVLQWWAEDPDGRLYLYREIFHSKRLVEDHARDALKQVRKGRAWSKKGFSDDQWREPRPRAIIADHDAEDRATLERHLGMSTIPARKSVSDGIQAVEARLRPADDGKPRLFIMRGCTIERDQELDDAKRPCSTAEEVPGYVWLPPSAGRPAKEEPLKENDDGCDAMRYIVAERDFGVRPRIRWFG